MDRRWREFLGEPLLGSVEALFCSGCRATEHETDLSGGHLLPDCKANHFLVSLPQPGKVPEGFFVLLVADDHDIWC